MAFGGFSVIFLATLFFGILTPTTSALECTYVSIFITTFTYIYVIPLKLQVSSTVELEPTQLGSSSLLIFDCSNLLNIKNEIKHEPTKKPFKSSQNHLKKGKIVQFLGIFGSFKELLTSKMAFLIA